jgi:uncharacterized membrane protein
MNERPRGIPIGEAFQFGWDVFKKNVEFILAIEVAAIVAVSVVNAASALSEELTWFHTTAVSFANFVLSMIINLGAIKIALKYRDGDEVEFANMFDSFSILPSFMAASVLISLAVGFGLMFLLIPGIFIAVRCCFFGFFVVEAGEGPIEAIQRSYRITAGFGLDLFFFALLAAGVNLLGVLALGLGVFVSIPVTYLAWAYIYRYLEPAEATARDQLSPNDHRCE